MNQATFKCYPHQTTLAVPGYVRPPTTLFEHFRADPRGATSFKQWREDRIYELLSSGVLLQYRGSSGGFTNLLRRHDRPWCIISAMENAHCQPPDILPRMRITLLDGTIIKEWLPETKDSHNVEKT